MPASLSAPLDATTLTSCRHHNDAMYGLTDAPESSDVLQPWLSVNAQLLQLSVGSAQLFQGNLKVCTDCSFLHWVIAAYNAGQSGASHVSWLGRSDILWLLLTVTAHSLPQK